MTEKASRALLGVLGALLIQFATVVTNYGSDFTAGLLTTGLLALGLLSLIAAVGSPQPIQQASRLSAAALATGSIAGVYIAAVSAGPTTDAFTFTQYAGELFLQGENPYSAAMQPAFDRYAREPLRPTYRVDGSHVTTYSYPAASILYGALGAGLRSLSANAFYILLSALLSAAGVVIYLDVPRELTALAPISLLASKNLWLSASGGIIDGIWLLPLLAAMVAWHNDRLGIAGLWFGAAIAAKQQPWLIAPAAVIVLYRTAPAGERVNQLLRFVAPAAGVFIVVNAPFIIADPVAWLEGVFVAVDATKPAIVQDGIGIVVLSTVGGIQLSSGALTSVMLAVAALSYGLVYWKPHQFQSAIWLIPPVVLFWSPRSLASYFTMFTPVAALALGQHTCAHQTNA